MSKNTCCSNATERWGFRGTKISIIATEFLRNISISQADNHWRVFSPTQAQENREQCSLIQYRERNTEESHQDWRGADSIGPKLSAGTQTNEMVSH